MSLHHDFAGSTHLHIVSVSLAPTLLLVQSYIKPCSQQPAASLQLSIKITCVITAVTSQSEWGFSWARSEVINNQVDWDRRWGLQNKSTSGRTVLRIILFFFNSLIENIFPEPKLSYFIYLFYSTNSSKCACIHCHIW